MQAADAHRSSALAQWLAITASVLLALGLLVGSFWAGGSNASSAESSTPGTLTLAVLALLLGAASASWALLRRQRLTSELRDARAALRSLTDLLDVWQWQTDAQHRIVRFQPPVGGAATTLASARPGRPLIEPLQCLEPGVLQSVLERQLPFDELEVSYADGCDEPAEAVPARLRGRPRYDERGAFAGFIGTLREVPIQVAAPATSLTVAAPVAGLAPTVSGPDTDTESDAFSYTVSHDLRAPIRVVEGFTRIVKEDYGRLLDRIGNDHLDRVLGAAARMNSMIDALLALSKLSSQPLQRQPVNLTQLAGYVHDDLRRQSPQRQVTLHLEPGLQVLGDPTLLRVVLENLLGNAWKYTGKCAQAEIWFGRDPADAGCFAVRDNGAGFDMRFADRLFGVFQRLHSATDFQGTGIGLASVRRILRRHGGDIWAEAEVERGATFHFTLPQTPTRTH